MDFSQILFGILQHYIIAELVHRKWKQIYPGLVYYNPLNKDLYSLMLHFYKKKVEHVYFFIFIKDKGTQGSIVTF